MKSSSKEKSSWNGFRWFIAKSTTGKVSFMFTLGPLDHQVPLVSMPARFARWESVNPGRCWCIGSVSQLRNTGLRKHGSYIGAHHNFPFILSKRETVSLHWNANQFCLGREGVSWSIFRDGEVLYHIGQETNLIFDQGGLLFSPPPPNPWKGYPRNSGTPRGLPPSISHF